MDKRLSVYTKYSEKADTCSIFATVCPNHFHVGWSVVLGLTAL